MSSRLKPFSRRRFLQSTSQVSSAIALASIVGGSRLAAEDRNPKRILLRSSWQTVNIGNIAHTPGALRILETHLPQVEITLWPSSLGNGVEKLLSDRFPKLRFAKDEASLRRAFEQRDFLLHSSGASLVAEKDVVRWSQETGKPYGIYGITLPPKKSSSTIATPEHVFNRTIQVLSKARFVYFRDSRSLALAKERGCSCPVMEFGPDGAFATDLRDEAKAEAFLERHGLRPGHLGEMHLPCTTIGFASLSKSPTIS